MKEIKGLNTELPELMNVRTKMAIFRLELGHFHQPGLVL